jgi:CARDB
MLRAALISLALAVPLGGAVARAQTATAPPALRASLVTCQTGLEPADRYAIFSASMPASGQATHMWLRFDLYVRKPGHRAWHHLDVPKWGVWQKSNPGVPGLVAAKRVDELAPPASYRAFVRFRWYDDTGIVRSERRLTRACPQPDPRPDLVLAAVTATPSGAETARYAVVVRNAGRGAAGPFTLVLSTADGEQPAAPVEGLAAGDGRLVTIEAPRCTPGETIRIALDPENMVDEVHEAVGPVVRPCPLEARG